MAKVLIKKEKKEFIEDIGREVTLSKEKYYYVVDVSKDFHCAEGLIKKEDLAEKDGSKVKTNKGKEFFVFESTYLDDYKRIRRLPQTIPLKDIGVIMSETGIGKESVVIDSGTGSGGVACLLGNFVKEVYSYDIKDEHLKVSKENVEMLGLNNVHIKKGSIYEGVEEKEADLFILDVPEPWMAINTIRESLKIGGFVVSYSPMIPQVIDFVNEIKKDGAFIVEQTSEITQRYWDVDGRKVRPKTAGIGHSGFLTFVRRIA